MFKKKYICVKQHDMKDCGAACISTILKTYGYSTSISRIREICETDEFGTNLNGIIQAVEMLGFTAKAVKGNKTDIKKEFPLPAIAHVLIDNTILHYVVIHEINEKKNRVTIADPDKGIVELTKEEFLKIWTGVLVILVPSQRFKKGKENESVIKRFFYLLKPQKSLLINIFLASLLYTILGIVASFYFKFLMDEILPNSLKGTLHVISIAFLLLYIFQCILNLFRSHLLLYLSQKLDISLILGYYNHVLGLPMNFFRTRKVGEIVSRFMDASKIREAISSATLIVMIDSFMVFGGGVILFLQSKLLFCIAFSIAFIYGIIAYGFNKPFKENQEKIMEENSQLTSYLVESLQGIETIKSFNSEQKSELETEKKFVRLLNTTFKGGMIQNIQGTLKNITELTGTMLILWVGSIQVIDGVMSIGQLLTFNSLLVYFLTPIKNIINLQLSMQTAVVSAERLTEILDLELEKTDLEYKKISPKNLSGDISFKEVSFKYGSRGKVLENITLNIRQGEKIALVGESGSGKTTLAKLLLNFYKINSGDITFGDFSIEDINKGSLRERIGYISQDIFLFSGTIEENLRLGNKDIPLEDIIRICKLTTVHDFVEKMELRYSTLIDENGANLSGGQKQRIALARVLIKNPDIIIMDEATSNLDSATEKSIENLITQNCKNKTMIIIAHRLSTIKSCDKIYVIDKGSIYEEGTHEELINLKGKYHKLWESQFA